jgi:hypothetical protein
MLSNEMVRRCLGLHFIVFICLFKKSNGIFYYDFGFVF